MRKQFDLEYYKEKPNTMVVTRLGSEVSSIKEMEDGGIWVTVKLGEKRELSFTSTKNGLSGWDSEKDPLDLFFELPEPMKKKVPLTYEDMLQRVKEGKNMWVLFDDGSNFLILAFNKEGVAIADGENYYRETGLFEYDTLEIVKAHFADGDPCWKEVEK